MFKKPIYFIPILFCICCALSCRKPISESALEFHFFSEGDKKYDTPTLAFDTVFTSIGSITKKFTVLNKSNGEVKTTIFLAGTPSQYSINVNGMSGNTTNNSYFKDVIIPKKDSIFVLVTVNINPLNQNAPFFL
jgi:hypothetical protein